MIRILAAAAPLALLAGVALAQTPAQAPAQPAVKHVTTTVTAPAAQTKTTKTTTVTHTAASIDCSKQADAKGLHGKARKDFRSSCKAAAKKN